MQKTVPIERRSPLERELDDVSGTLETIQHYADKLELSIPDTLAVLVESMRQLDDLGLMRLTAKRDCEGVYLYARIFLRLSKFSEETTDFTFSV